MSYHTDIIQDRTATATTQIAKRYGVDPAAIKWEVTREGAVCLFTSGDRHHYLASVGFDKNVMKVFMHTRSLNLN